MLKKEIVDKIKQLYLSSNNQNFIFSFKNDRINFTQEQNGYVCNLQLCFYRFHHYMLKLEGQKIIKSDLEKEFEKLITPDLIHLNDNKHTFTYGGAEFECYKAIDFVLLENEEVLQIFFNNFMIYLQEVKEKFFIPGEKVEYLASLIAEHEYKNQSKILVGGKFPVHILKKIFILKKGSQEESYIEYKEGLKNQIATYGDRNPEEAHLVPLFQKCYSNIINYLEHGTMPLDVEGENSLS